MTEILHRVTFNLLMVLYFLALVSSGTFGSTQVQHDGTMDYIHEGEEVNNEESALDFVSLDFSHNPLLPKPNEVLLLEATLNRSESHDRVSNQEVDHEAFRWYFREPDRDSEHQLLGVGPSLKWPAMEGFYNLSLWNVMSPSSSPSLILSTVKFIGIMRKLNVSIRVNGEPIVKSELVTVNLTTSNLSAPLTFTIDCEFTGSVSNMLFIKPKNSTCAFQSVQELSPLTTNLHNKDCTFLPELEYGCQADNDLGSAQLNVRFRPGVIQLLPSEAASKSAYNKPSTIASDLVTVLENEKSQTVNSASISIESAASRLPSRSSSFEYFIVGLFVNCMLLVTHRLFRE